MVFYPSLKFNYWDNKNNLIILKLKHILLDERERKERAEKNLSNIRCGRDPYFTRNLNIIDENNDEVLLSEILENNYIYSNIDDQYIHEDVAVYLDYIDDYTNSENVIYCEDCGEPYHTTDDNHPDRYICPSCCEELEEEDEDNDKYYNNKYNLSYSYRFDYKILNNEGYGVELEIVNRRDKTDDVERVLNNNGVKTANNYINSPLLCCTYDGTASSEIVSAILKPSELMEVYKPLLDDLKEIEGVRSHDIKSGCSLHIHISKSLFNSSQHMARYAYFIHKNKRFFIKISRRSEQAYLSWCKLFEDYEIDRDAFLNEVQAINLNNILPIYMRGRKAINIYCKGRNFKESYNLMDNIELRIFQGTLNYTSFYSCIMINHYLIKYTKNNYNLNIEDFIQYVLKQEEQDSEEKIKKYLNKFYYNKSDLFQ